MAKIESLKEQALKAILDGKVSNAKLNAMLSDEAKEINLTTKQKEEIYNSMKLEEMKKEVVKLPDDDFKKVIKKLEKGHNDYMSKLKILADARQKIVKKAKK